MSSHHVKAFGLKMAGQGAECSDEMLAKINTFALVPLKAEEVYVRKLLLAHNCIDRDNERFPDAMLDDFARTIVGKSLLFGHNRKETGSGLFFDAFTEVMTCEQFKTLTGEEPRMPEGMTECKVLWAWFYTIKTGDYDAWLKWIDAGITRHCSIGFAAADLTAIRKEPNGPALYWEYCCPGEALEGSLVWLGAQPGATAQKGFEREKDPSKGEKTMKIVVAGIAALIGKTLADSTTEDALVTEVKTALDAKDLKIKELEGDAADGREYRKHLVDDTVRFGAMIGEIDDTEKAKADEETFLKTLPLARLKGMCEKYEAKAREKFPTKFTFKGKDETDRTKAKEDAEEKAQKTTGKKDYTDPAHNELFSLVGK